MRLQWLETGEPLSLDGEILGRGGEAILYAVAGHPELAAKVFHAPDVERAAKLAAMLQMPLSGPSGEPATLAWPVGCLSDLDASGAMVGYLMPRIRDAHPWALIANPAERRRLCPDFHHGRLLHTARSLAAAVRRLHERGCIVGDLSETNVLVAADGRVSLVDTDSFQVRGPDRIFRCRVGRPEYQPAELQGTCLADVDLLPEHDAFALAVLIFQLLMQGQHPFAGVFTCSGDDLPLAERIAAGYWAYGWQRSSPVRPAPHAPPWWALPPDVQELFWRCFEDGHDSPPARPSAADWEQALLRAEQHLSPCAVNDLHRYPFGLDRCPWCRHAEPAPRPRRSTPARAAVVARASARAPAKAAALPGLLAPLGWLGAVVERQSWLVWLGVGAAGAVAGLLWALQHPPLPAETAPAQPAPEQRAQLGPAPRRPSAVPPEVEHSPLHQAWLKCQQTERAYKAALSTYYQAVNEHQRGRRTKQEVDQCLLQVQQELRRYQQAERALREKVLDDGP
jgi:DNA-binding helix-hairpin-helix protein with protein kinase domain